MTLVVPQMVSDAQTDSTNKTTTEYLAAYGEDANSFANTLEKKTPQDQVIIVSEIKDNFDLQNIQSSIKNGTTLVAINLPLDNKLVSLPTLQMQANETIRAINGSNVNFKIKPVTTLEPSYWISVIKYEEPLLVSHFVTTNDTSEVRQEMISAALNAVEKTVFHKPTGTSNIMMSNQYLTTEENEANQEIQPISTDLGVFDDEHWDEKAEIDFTLYWNPQDQVRAYHSIYQAKYYSAVTNREYWLDVTYIQHYFGSFEDEGDPYYWHIGPYVRQITNYIDADIPFDEYDGLYKYGPDTTEPSQTASVNVAFNINTGGPTIGVGYSHSWTYTDTSYNVAPDGVNANIQTVVNFETYRDTQYSLPDYHIPPCAKSHESAYYYYSAVFQPEVGDGFDLASISDNWITCYDLTDYWQGWFNDYSYTVTWNPIRLTSNWGSASYTYASSLASPYSSTYGTASVTNRDYITGSNIDFNRAELKAEASGSVARIYTMLSAQSTGRIAINGYSQLGYDSRMIVYVSNDNVNWNQVSDQQIRGTSNYWIDCGYYSSQFRYILIVAYDSSTPAFLKLDAVRVYS